MIDVSEFLNAVRQYNVGLFSCVPCSLLKPLINYTISDRELHYVCAVSEGEATGIAAGSSLTGRIGIVMLQNSGLGNIINPITSLINIYKIPCLFIVSHRGDPDSGKDAVQHTIMGKITYDLLDQVGVYYQDFPSESSEIKTAVDKAFAYMQKRSLPAAFILKKNTIASHDLGIVETCRDKIQGDIILSGEETRVILTRKEAITAIVDLLDEQDLVVSATGMISRELYSCNNRLGNFYMQGSMGTTAAIGLGVALNKPEKNIVIVDGDGSILMRLGSLATVGYSRPRNYLHIVLDNACYDSTGGQESVSSSVSFPDFAVAAGYRRAATVYSQKTLCKFWQIFASEEGPSMLHVKIRKEPSTSLGRPSLTPEEIRDRFMESING